MPNLSLNNVSSHSYLISRVRHINEDIDLFHEVYAGSIRVEYQNVDVGTTTRETFRALLPISSNTIRQYVLAGDEFFHVTTLVSLGGVVAKEDEEFIVSIDSFSTELKTHEFPGIAGGVDCLVLSFDLALLNGVVLHVGYNVNVQVSGRVLSIEDLREDTKPQ